MTTSSAKRIVVGLGDLALMEHTAELDLQVFEIIREGSDIERREALQALVQAAQGSNEPGPWNRLAIGLKNAGRPGEAAKILQELIQTHPDVDVYRLTLATTHAEMRQFDLAQAHLQHLVEHASSEEMRALAREQLDGMNRLHGRTEADARLRQLQAAALREQIATGDTSARDYYQLAVIALNIARMGESGGGLGEATAVLESGRTRFPQAVPILELLTSCYLRDDPADRLPDLLLTLERLAPDSPVVEALRDQREDASQEFHTNMLERAQALIQEAQSPDPKVQAAALQELTEMVTQAPNNADYKIARAFALLGAGLNREAVEQADAVAAGAGESHSQHFNVGQILWIAGEAGRGRHHLELALEYADSPQDREDVLERIAELEQAR